MLAAREALAAEPGADPGVHAEAAHTQIVIGRALFALSRYDEALAAFDRVRDRLEPLVRAHPKDGTIGEKLAWAHANRSMVMAAMSGRGEESRKACEEALALRERLAAEHPEVTEHREMLGISLNDQGILLSNAGKMAEAEGYLRKALALRQKLVADNPGVKSHRDRLAETHLCLSYVMSGSARPAEAEAEDRAALAIYQKLADESPAVTRFREKVAATHRSLALTLADAGRPTEAEVDYHRAIEIYRKLAEEHPAVTSFRSSLASSLNGLAMLMADTGRPDQAAAEYREAIAIAQKLAEEHPEDPSFRSNLAGHRHNLAMVLADAGRPLEAEAEFRAAIALSQRSARDMPDVTFYRAYLGNHHYLLARVLADTGRPAEAEAEFRQALAIYQKLADDSPSRIRFSREPGQRPRDVRSAALAGGQPAGGGEPSSARRWPSSASWPKRPPRSRATAMGSRAGSTISPSCSAAPGELAEALEHARARGGDSRGSGEGGPQDALLPFGPGRGPALPRPDPPRRGRPRRRRGRRSTGRLGSTSHCLADSRGVVPLRLLPRRAGGPGRSGRLGRLGRRGGQRGRRGDGPAAQGRRDGLPQPRRLPHRRRPRSAPRPCRLPAPDDGPGLPGRAVRKSRMSTGPGPGAFARRPNRSDRAARSEHSCIRKAVSERGFTQTPSALRKQRWRTKLRRGEPTVPSTTDVAPRPGRSASTRSEGGQDGQRGHALQVTLSGTFLRLRRGFTGSQPLSISPGARLGASRRHASLTDVSQARGLNQSDRGFAGMRRPRGFPRGFAGSSPVSGLRFLAECGKLAAGSRPRFAVDVSWRSQSRSEASRGHDQGFAGSSPVSGLRFLAECGKLAAWPDPFALSFLARFTT